MERIFILIVAMAAVFCACQENTGSGDEPVGKINVYLTSVNGGVGSISAEINAMGVYKGAYHSWGVTYSETADKTQGTDYVASGTPSDGKVEVVLDGLKEESTYCLWAWAEAEGTERLWSSEPVSVRTRKYSPSAKLSGTVIGTMYSVDYSNNTQSVTVNTKNNVFDGDFETFFASWDRSGSWVGLDLGSKHVINKIGYSPRITI